MAEIGGAALGAAASFGVAAYSAFSAFSARHEQGHDAQVLETHRLIDRFEKLHAEGGLTEEDYEEFLEKKEIALRSGKEYHNSILEYKDVRALNIPKKLKAKSNVRGRKRKIRQANRDLHDHYYESASSFSSDASSITAESGSLPDSHNIQEWADNVGKSQASDSDEENLPKREFYPVKIGDSFSDGRYIVCKELGRGRSSTVWIAKDQKINRLVALKVVKSGLDVMKMAQEEIKLLQRHIASWTSTRPIAPMPNSPLSPAHTHPGRPHVISFLDHFMQRGPDDDMHVCMVFEMLGENLLGLIKRHQNSGVPMHLVKEIAKQIFLGLDYMHRCCSIIHGDLKPENVLICIENVESIMLAESSATASTELPPGSVMSIGRDLDETSSTYEVLGKKVTVKIANLREDTWLEYESIEMTQAWPYRCPEVIFGMDGGPSSDLWSVACTLFELITGGDLLFDPAPSECYSIDHDHIAQIIELLSDSPHGMAFPRKFKDKFFNRDGSLRHIAKLNYCSLEAVFHDKYLFPKAEAEDLANFLRPMLRIDPYERAKASDMLHHSWLECIVVQEINIVRRMEWEKKARKEAAEEARRRDWEAEYRWSGLSVLG